MFLSYKMYHSAVVQYNDLAEKRVACAYTTKNAMKIHIHCFSKSFAILFPFPAHVEHNYKFFWGSANLSSWFKRASTSKTDVFHDYPRFHTHVFYTWYPLPCTRFLRFPYNL